MGLKSVGYEVTKTLAVSVMGDAPQVVFASMSVLGCISYIETVCGDGQQVDESGNQYGIRIKLAKKERY